MNSAFTVDDREWKRAARQLFETSSRELPDFINGQALKVASEAFDKTHRANIGKIEKELGQIAREVRLKKSKRWVKSPWKQGARVLRENSLAARILAKRFQITGEWGIRGKTLVERAANLIASRARSVNFIRSGWIPAITILGNRVKGGYFRKYKAGGKIYGVSKGGALPARRGVEVASEIFNTALNTEPKPPSRKGNPLITAQRGLIRAMSIAAKDMEAEFARRMQRHYDQVSTR